jgi:hypothetical protein
MLIGALLVAFAGVPVAVFAADATPTPAVVADRALTLIGNWNCESKVGFSGTRSFQRDSLGSIFMRNNFRLPTGPSTVVIETFRFNSARQRWTVTAVESDYFGAMQLEAPAWTGDTWTFEGWQDRRARDNTTVRDTIRVIYSDLTASAFARQQKILIDGIWRTYNEESCTRAVLR